MELIDRENHQKLYLQLLQIIRKKIENRDWPIGSQIPTEEELCTTYNVSRATVRSAVLDLVRQGYLKRQQGKGTFVHKDVINEGLSMQTSFRELLFDESLNFATSVLARTVMMPVDGLDIMLDIPSDKHIIFIKRIRLLDNEPVLLQETYIPYHICPLLLEDDIGQHDLLDLCEKNYGIKITKIKNHIDIAHLNENESRMLKLSKGSAAVLLTQYFYSGETLMMFTRSLKKPEKFQFVIEMERKFV